MAKSSKNRGMGYTGPVRSPMAGFLTNDKVKLNVPTGANTTMPGTAPKSAPIQSPLVTRPGAVIKT